MLELPGTVTVAPPTVPSIVMAVPSPGNPVVVPVVGPTGPKGDPGEIGDIVPWFTGHGPPGVVPGSRAGSMYIDVDSGQLYQLN